MSSLKVDAYTGTSHVEGEGIDHGESHHQLATKNTPPSENLELERAAFEGRKIDLRTVLAAIVSAFSNVYADSKT